MQQIILRARQAHLLQRYIESHSDVTPEVVATLKEAWKAYVQKAFGKSMADVAEQWSAFCTKVEKGDPSILRGEKFDMHFQLAVMLFILVLCVQH